MTFYLICVEIFIYLRPNKYKKYYQYASQSSKAANNSISDIHERMPVVLRADEKVEWLSENADFDKIFDRQNIQLKRIPA